MRVTVLGGGIIGTTTAYRLKRRHPALDIRIVAEKFSPNTTSDVAAGWLEPHLDPDTPPNLIQKWSGATYELCSAIWRSEPIEELDGIQEKVKKAVSLMNGIGVGTDPGTTHPPWEKEILGYTVYPDPASLAKLGFVDGDGMVAHSYLSFTLEASILLPILYDWLRDRGVELVERRVDTLEDFPKEEVDLLINCTGIGASTLAEDPALYPISGHVIRIEDANIKLMLSDWREESWAYIIPNRDVVILGSVDIPNNWDTTVKPENSQSILKNCGRLCPLQDVKIVNERVGLRPCRRGGVRLEMEDSPKYKIIHNYGHGGSGVTLSWGCAAEVLQLFDQLNSQL